MEFYSQGDCTRQSLEPTSKMTDEPYRGPFSRDYSRILHSPSFRRLVGKTQLFPNNEFDFFRNRLTHSLEVAQIATAIAKKLNYENEIKINLDLVNLAGLAHDIGHPPFGHQGEEALDERMLDHGGFEGNAQTLRILSTMEKKIIHGEDCPFGINDEGEDLRVGLNLCYRSLAAVLKYDEIIPTREIERKNHHSVVNDEIKPVKGYYATDENLVSEIKNTLLKQESTKSFKSLECSIMDIADDIAYSNYDLEDCFKAGFLNPLDIMYPNPELMKGVVGTVIKRTKGKIDDETEIDEFLISRITRSIYGGVLKMPKKFKKHDLKGDQKIDVHVGTAYESSKNIASHGALRTKITSSLVGEFIRNVELVNEENDSILWSARLKQETLIKVEVLKAFAYESQISSPKLKIAEIRGKEIVNEIFEKLSNHDKKGYSLLPEDFQIIYLASKEDQRMRVICDYIAGMTNTYAIEFYGRLKSEDPETIFKPL